MSIIEAFPGSAADAFAVDSTDLVPTQPQLYEVGRVEGRYPLSGKELEALGLPDALTPAEINQYEVDDAYIAWLEAGNPGRVAEIQAQEAVMDQFAGRRLAEGKWQRKTGTAYEAEDGKQGQKNRLQFGDPVSLKKYFGAGGLLDDPAANTWRSDMLPSAAALLPLADPYSTTHVVSRRGQLVPVSELTRDWFTACTDGQEIRNRGAIMAHEARDFLIDYAASRPGEQITMLSVASGTALPTIQAAVSSGIENIRLVLLENDPKSQAMAAKLADDLGFRGELDIRPVDVFDPVEMDALAQELEATGTKAAFTDAMGIFEYTDPALREQFRGAPDDRLIFHPDEFLKRIMNLTKPGGRVHFGQMYNGRPNPNFTFGVICWPCVCMRSPSEVMEVVRNAGGDLARTRLGLTPKKVYMTVSVDLPLAEEAPQDTNAMDLDYYRRRYGQLLVGRTAIGSELN